MNRICAILKGMKRDIYIASIRKKAMPILRRSGVVRSAVFGSVARGEAKRTSDIDFLIEFKGRKTLFDLAGLKLALEDALKKKVDLVTYDSLHPLLEEYILKDQKLIYEKKRNRIHKAYTGKH